MASLHRLGKKGIYTAMWRDAKGKQWKRSTETTDRKTAQGIADNWERLANTPPAQVTMQQVQRVIAEIYRSVTGNAMASSQAAAYIRSWLDIRKPELATLTFSKYTQVLEHFLSSMAAAQRGDISIHEVVKQDVLRWRKELLTEISSGTVNNYIKILRQPLSQAKEDGLIADNAAKQVKAVKASATGKRKPYKHAQLSQVLECCDDEWKSMVVFGYYTSQRLGDIALLKRKQVDLLNHRVTFVTGKRGRTVIVEMNEDFHNWVLSQPTTDNPEDYVHPRAAGFVLATKSRKGTGTLSNQFGVILWKAGLRKEKPYKAKKPESGPSRRRDQHELVFHSLRHTLTSDLANADVSRVVMMDIVGHDSVEVNQIYTHIDAKSKRNAMKRLPNITPGNKGKQLDLGLDGAEGEVKK